MFACFNRLPSCGGRDSVQLRRDAKNRARLQVEQLEDRTVPARLFGATGGDSPNGLLLSIDQATGAATVIAPILLGGTVPISITGMDFDPATGILYGTTAGGSPPRNLVTIDPQNGTATLVGPIGLGGGGIPDIAFDPTTGILFGWSENSDDLIVINKATGQGTVVGNAGIGTARTGLEANSAGTLFLAGQGANGALRTVNKATGQTTVVATLNGAPLPNGGTPALTFQPGTDILFAINGVNDNATTNLVTINTITGAVTNIGPSAANLDAIAFQRGGPGTIVVGADAASHVEVFAADDSVRFSFLAYDGFSGAVRVASGDVSGDGIADIITGAGPGHLGGHVKVFDGQTGAEIQSFLAFPGFMGGVFVAAGYVNNDNRADIVVGADAGHDGGHVKVFDGLTGAEIQSFLAFPGFMGGVNVAAADVNNDNRADVVVGAGAGAPGGHVKVFSGADNALLQSFLAFPGFSGGVFVAAGYVNSDAFADVITGAGPGAGSHVRVFSGNGGAELQSFFAYAAIGADFMGGVRVGSVDRNGDGIADILTGAGPVHPGGHVKAFDGLTLAERDSFFAFAGFMGGVFVA